LISINTNQIEDTEIIPVSLQNSMIDIDTSHNFQNIIEIRTAYIKNKTELERMADDLADDLWIQYYKSYYENVLYKRIEDMPLKDIIKYIIKRSLFTKENTGTINETFLLHNIQIESHRWLVERYLCNKNFEINKRMY
jgi:hypothetical protein